MAKFTRRNFIKASVATGIVGGAIAAPAVVSPFRRSVVATGAKSAPAERDATGGLARPPRSRWS